MKHLNKRTEFDKQWEDAFKDAEMAPSEGVWDKIDSTLSKEEAGYFRRRALIYKLLAAASIIFALGVVMFSINYYLGQQVEPMALLENESDQKQIFDDESSSSLELATEATEKGSVENRKSIEKEGHAEETNLAQMDNEEEGYSDGVNLAVTNKKEIYSGQSAENASILLIDKENNDPIESISYGDNLHERFSLNELGKQGISLTVIL